MATRTRRLRWLDWVLIATLVPLYFVLLVLQIREGLETGAPTGFIQASSAASKDDFPVFWQEPPDVLMEGETLRFGDRLLKVGDRSLAGATSVECGLAVLWAVRRLGGARLAVARGEERFEAVVLAKARPLWWSSIPFGLGWVVVSLILLFRATNWSAVRKFFLGSLLTGIFFAGDTGMLGVVHPSVLYIALAAWSIGLGVAIASWWYFTASALPLPVWARALPWVVGTALLSCAFGMIFLPASAASISARTFGMLTVLSFFLCLVGLTRAYTRSDALERRQLRWVLYGLYLGLIPGIAANIAVQSGLLGQVTLLPITLSQLFTVAGPLGVLVAVLGYRFLDIDRVISATTSYTIVGVTLLGVALQVIPRVAEAASSAAGLSETTGQWALSLAFAALAVQGHRQLRPWLDRRMFADRAAVEEGLAALVAELGRCSTALDLTRLSGERIDALLRPESIAVYAREEDAFTVVFARGRTVPPAFGADTPLAKTLESRSAPVVASAAALDPFDRAALATLDAEVVVPTHRGAALVAFTCLGRKRSGDIYTPAELALLTAVASAIGSVLRGLGDAEVIDQARAMQASLRRYVPGAVAEHLESGRDLQAGEREVTVLFVDLRGYTSYAEKRPVEDVFSTVNEHTERVSRIVRARGGAVVEFNGDGMMAVFGAPEALAAKERQAIEVAREIVDTSPADLAVGIGIASGLAYAGNIRAADRWIWSVIGDTTNLAARLQALTREFDASIAVDEPTRRAAGYVCADFTRHQDVQLRGRSQRVDVFVLPLARGERG